MNSLDLSERSPGVPGEFSGTFLGEFWKSSMTSGGVFFSSQ